MIRLLPRFRMYVQTDITNHSEPVRRTAREREIYSASQCKVIAGWRISVPSGRRKLKRKKCPVPPRDDGY